MPVSLCDDCRFARSVASARGSRFILCERSLADARYPKYPRLPVLTCPGYAARRDQPHPPSP